MNKITILSEYKVSLASFKSYLLRHEQDIYEGINDFDDLRCVFRNIFNRNADINVRTID